MNEKFLNSLCNQLSVEAKKAIRSSPTNALCVILGAGATFMLIDFTKEGNPGHSAALAFNNFINKTISADEIE